jgi:hypothetical protein
MTTEVVKISRPKSAYILFCKNEREQVKKDIPDIQNKDILSELGKRWKKLPESDPERYAKFQSESEEDKQRYKSEVESSGTKPLRKVRVSKSKKDVVEVQTVDNTPQESTETLPEKKKRARATRQKKNKSTVEEEVVVVPPPTPVEVVVQIEEPPAAAAPVVEEEQKPVATKRLRKGGGKSSKK